MGEKQVKRIVIPPRYNLQIGIDSMLITTLLEILYEYRTNLNLTVCGQISVGISASFPLPSLHSAMLQGLDMWKLYFDTFLSEKLMFDHEMTQVRYERRKKSRNHSSGSSKQYMVSRRHEILAAILDISWESTWSGMQAVELLKNTYSFLIPCKPAANLKANCRFPHPSNNFISTNFILKYFPF